MRAQRTLFPGHNHAAQLENTPGRAIARASRRLPKENRGCVWKEVRVLATQRLTPVPKAFGADSEKESPSILKAAGKHKLYFSRNTQARRHAPAGNEAENQSSAARSASSRRRPQCQSLTRGVPQKVAVVSLSEASEGKWLRVFKRCSGVGEARHRLRLKSPPRPGRDWC